MSMKPHFETKQLALHRACSSDLNFLFKLYQNQEMMTYLGGTLTQELIEERLKKWNTHWDDYGFGLGIVRLKDSPQEIGVCILFHTEIEGEKLLEIGWMIDIPYQGRGFATEIAKSYMDFAIRDIHAKLFAAFPNDKNIPSNRICEKLGFLCMGQYRYHFLDRTLDTRYWRYEVKSL